MQLNSSWRTGFFLFFFRPHDYPKWNHMGSEMKSLRKTSQQSYIPRGKVSLLKIGGFSIYWCQAPKNLIRFNKEERKLKKCQLQCDTHQTPCKSCKPCTKQDTCSTIIPCIKQRGGISSLKTSSFRKLCYASSARVTLRDGPSLQRTQNKDIISQLDLTDNLHLLHQRSCPFY